MRYKLILWDFDGTLADTLAGAVRIYNDLAVRDGYAVIEDAEAARNTPIPQLLASLRIPPVRLPLLAREFFATQRREIGTVRLHEGIPELLQNLRRSGVRLGVVSSNVEENIRICLGANGVEDCFEFVVGYTRILGKHRALRRAMRARAAPPRETLYVGDEVRDIEAARMVGIDVAAVFWGANSPSLLSQYAPDYLIAQPADFSALFEG